MRMRRAQSTVEYALVIACVIAALLAMRAYVARGIQGRLRSEADQLGQQYAPGRTTSSISTTYSSHTTSDVSTETEGNMTSTTSTTVTDYDTVARSGTEAMN
jgi:hypothetical protein